MKVRLSSRFRHGISKLLVTSALMIAAHVDGYGVLNADEYQGGDPATTIQEPSNASCEFELRDAAETPFEEELCGWATHDSCPVDYPRVARRTSASFDQSIAAAAATACASAGISVEQIVEPFAMVGPNVVDAMDRVQEFQDWWRKLIEQSREFALATPSLATKEAEAAADPMDEFGVSVVVEDFPPLTSEIEERIDRLALEEPIDVADFGESVLIAQTKPLSEPVTIVSAAQAQVGSSPIIVSIEDTYLPYDLSARDFRVWSVFPLVTEPFCVRSRHDHRSSFGGWQESDSQASDAQASKPSPTDTVANQGNEAINESVLEEVPTQTPSPVIDETIDLRGSVDCLLDEFVWKLTCTVEDHRSLRKGLRPRYLGKKLAMIALRVSRVAGAATEQIAGVWPDTAPVVEIKKPTAGQRLLARAGAVEADAPVVDADAPRALPDAAAGPAAIAELPGKTLR